MFPYAIIPNLERIGIWLFLHLRLREIWVGAKDFRYWASLLRITYPHGNQYRSVKRKSSSGMALHRRHHFVLHKVLLLRGPEDP